VLSLGLYTSRPKYLLQELAVILLQAIRRAGEKRQNCCEKLKNCTTAVN
jgi:hypothetical protein